MKNCHEFETDHGRRHRETAEKSLVSEDRYVTHRETLQIGLRYFGDAIRDHVDEESLYGAPCRSGSYPTSRFRLMRCSLIGDRKVAWYSWRLRDAGVLPHLARRAGTRASGIRRRGVAVVAVRLRSGRR